MPNQITANGLTVKTSDELVTYFTTFMQVIYGNDIVLTSDSPDGQMMMDYIQAALDNLDLAVQVYNSMDPDKATGTVLDSRVAYNGIQRQAGTYTITPVDITTDRALTLIGLDDPSITDPSQAYTVADNAGTQWYLANTQNPVGAGTATYNFQAALIGATISQPNTIQNPVTIVIGVTTINNPTTFTTLGINEETDAQLRVRRQKSVALASQGFNDALEAALENINGVISASVYENDGDATDPVTGVPSHSMWTIIDGTASAALIANAIYTKRSMGCGMVGAQTYTITRPNGQTFTVRWDFVAEQTLYVQMHATALNGGTPNTGAIIAQLPGLLNALLGVYGQVNINEISTLVQQIDPNTLVTFPTGYGVSADGVTYVYSLFPTLRNNQFQLASGNIVIV